MAWWEYIPGVSGVGNLMQGDYAEAAVGFTPYAPVYQGGKDLYNTDLMQHDVLPALGLKKSPEEQAMIDQMRQAATSYQNYRPEVAQARMNSLHQGLQMMSPYTQAMEQMYGPGSTPDFSKVQDPFGRK